DSPVGLDAPQEPAIPREAVRPYARRWNRPDDLAALRLHQEEFPGGRDCHPVLVVDPLQAVAARRCRDTPVQPGSWRDPRLQRLSTRGVDFQGTRRRRRIAHLRRGNPERVVSPGDAAAVNGLGLKLTDHGAIVGPDLERLVGIDLVEYPETVADELQVVRLRRALDLVQLLDPLRDARHIRRRARSGENRKTCEKRATRYLDSSRHTLLLPDASTLEYRSQRYAPGWPILQRGHPMRTAFIAAAAFMLGIATVARHGDAVQAQGSRRVIRPEKGPNTGLPFSPGVLVGNTLYISGHLGRDPVTSRLVSGGIERETRQALANIREVLTTAGMDFSHVTSVTAYIASFDEFAKFNA